MISVIIPNHYDTETLPRAVDSVNALDAETETIIVDNTGRKPVAKLVDDDVRVVEAPPQSPGANRNAGLRVARGEYIQFLDADDELLNVAERRTALQNSGASVAIGATRRRELDGSVQVVTPEHPGCPARAYLADEFRVTLGAVLCEREVFTTHRFDESLSRAQDFDLWARVFADCMVTVTDEVAFTYYQYPEQRARQNIHHRFKAQRQACRRIAADHPDLEASARRRWWKAWGDEIDWLARDSGLPGPVERVRQVQNKVRKHV